MVSTNQPIKVVRSRAGQPLYLAVRDAVRQAVDQGVFRPGQRLPSTKELASQLEVSLVTAHRAMHELVASGVIRRMQGRGTFVHERFAERRHAATSLRLGVICHDITSQDLYHRAITFDGIRQAAQQIGVDLVIFGHPEDVRNECKGVLLVDPPPQHLARLIERAGTTPVLSLGTRCPVGTIDCIEIDNIEMGRRAVSHLCDLGHQNLGFMGGDDNVINAHDRWTGFLEACQRAEVSLREQNVIRGISSHLDERKRMTLIRSLSSPQRPTAIFAAGYDFAMDVLETARTIGLSVPRELSIIAVDDPPSAPHLAPPLTTFRRPLVELGHAAVNALLERIQQPANDAQHRTLRAELIIRGSTGPAVS